MVEQIAQGTGALDAAAGRSGATLAPKLERATRSSTSARARPRWSRRVRALAPSPGAATRVDGERLRILAARAQPGPVDAEPGTLRRGAEPLLRIATGDGWLVPLVVQRAGGRPLAIDAFLRGRPIPDGESSVRG